MTDRDAKQEAVDVRNEPWPEQRHWDNALLLPLAIAYAATDTSIMASASDCRSSARACSGDVGRQR